MGKTIPGAGPFAEQAADTRFATSFDVNRVRADFPALSQELSPGVPLVYFDSPRRLSSRPRSCKPCRTTWPIYPANVHRGLHSLSERATAAYEGARETVARFLGTDGFRPDRLHARHHRRDQPGGPELGSSCASARRRDRGERARASSNLVPWQMLARSHGACAAGSSSSQTTPSLTSTRSKPLMSTASRLVAVTGMSNVTGTIPPLRRDHHDGPRAGSAGADRRGPEPAPITAST